MFKTKRTKQTEEFIHLLVRLTPEEFFGVCKLLGVKAAETDEDGKVVSRAGETMIDDCIQAFYGRSKEARHNLLVILRSVTGGKE